MKLFLQCLTLASILLLIIPDMVYADTGGSNPAYYVEWEDEYYSNNFLADAVISFPNAKEVQADAGYRFLMVNGILLPDAVVVIQDDRVLVPVRIVGEALGAEISWNTDARQITISKDDTQIVMTIDSKNITINENDISLNVPATLIDDCTYVPLLFVSENLGVNVGYYNEKPFASFPVIWIETTADQRPISEEQAVQVAKIIFTTALDETDKNELENMGGGLRDIINQLECLGDFSRFWIIGQRENTFMLVDKYDATVFSFRGMYGVFWINESFNLANFMVS